ncbi:MAG TPA: zinc-binding dehydrogenase, partial [Pyrinomonadaceae bacterium]|nr:zinc-binding dehydrogenase [Pyrinomonadaceae bacterium]
QSLFSRQKAVMFIARSNEQDLTSLGQLIATGKVTPVIDRVCKLDETPEAVAYLEQGHARGKVVIGVAG